MFELSKRSKENYKKYGEFIPKVRAYSETIEDILETTPQSFSI